MRRIRATRLAHSAAKTALAAFAAGAVVAIAGFGVSWVVVQAPLENADSYPEGLVLRARDGSVLRVKLGPGDVDCSPRRTALRDEWIAKAIVASEDKRFYQHCGADFLALFRAIVQDVVFMHRVSGASTLTEQVVRLIEPHPRNFRSKWIELIQALKTERRRSKDWILAQYLDRAPFGEMYIGVAAAARGWFDKNPEDLSLGEAALLAGMVQAPSRFRPDLHMDRAVKRRDYVLSRMEALGMASHAQIAAARAAPPRLVRSRRPFRAPHYCDWAERKLVPQGVNDAILPLDPATQRIAEDAVAESAAALGADCAVVVLDVQTGDVVAMASSGDWLHGAAGKVNGALSPRPTGSIVKPFFFARALERGLIAPTEILPDTPKAFRWFVPGNFGGGHSGAVRADQALVRSLNLPFYEIVRRLGVSDAIATLRHVGLADDSATPEKHGLGIAAGNIDATLLAVALAYADFSKSAETNAAARIVSEILSGEDRSLAALGHVADTVVPRAAWKTGTSAAHRDAWTALWTPREVVAVRCGHSAWHFGDAAVTGAGAAAPVAWRIFRAMHPDGESPWYGAEPADMVRREVCARTGLPPSVDCPERRSAWAIAGRTSVRPCQGHKKLFGGNGGETEQHQGSANRHPNARPTLRILRPATDSSIRLPGAAPWTVACTASGLSPEETLWWTVDGTPAGKSPAGSPFQAEITSPGLHAVSCTAADGSTASVSFRAEPAEKATPKPRE